MRKQVVGFCELYMLAMGSWSVMGGSTLDTSAISKGALPGFFREVFGYLVMSSGKGV